MENQSTPASSTAVGVRYGLLTGLISVIISFALNVAGLENSPAKWLTLLILIGAIVLAHRAYKQQNGGFMSYGQGLGIGTTLSAVSGVLSAIFTYVYVTIIDTNFIARLMDKTRADMEAKGSMSDEQIDQAMAMTGKFMNGPMMMVSVLIGAVMMGLLASLIISAITKNNRPEFE
ncbi:DUF4199 domain-containing protein [Hymenobacter chitinivorans]|uniref:Uncharacterized protein DUF4199 n=1 Tax=Hymenobacter chitinivorans DSM 11115 TaxID=1121954 RepID=A0A2M9BTN1_9BACT|nr:DUF4199 domain-containing protein [Hymenobacter chitinivorans]PJJ61297.1 uncharacterized protein DUF4199 [Hymenobacter chitinivorans DSM 11115]